MENKLSVDEFEKLCHGLIREWVIKLQEEGFKLDKKQLRYNDLVSIAIEYYKQSNYNKDVGLSGLEEALQCCIIDCDMYIPKGSPLTLLDQFKLTENI